MTINRKLGRKPHRFIPGVRALSDYVAPSLLPVLPPSVKNSAALDATPMFANDRLGDCTVAAMAHQSRAWVLGNGGQLAVTDAEVIDRYTAFGYVPGKPDTDEGAVEAHVLRYWTKHEFCGVSLDGLATVNPRAIRMIKACIFLLGGCYIGVELPIAVENLNEWPAPKGHTAEWEPNSWGGHAVTLLDYADTADRRDTTFYAVSWGKVIPVASEFLLNYCTEAWALLSNEWADANGAPNGLNYAALKGDLRLLRA